MLKYLFLAVTLCALFGVICGLLRFFRHKSALYARMIVFGVACAMMGRLFDTLQLFINGEVQTGFNIGELGVVGSFLYLFTSNFGQMDSLVDDGSDHLLKYRLIPGLAPLVVVGVYAYYFTRVGFGENAIVSAVEAAVIAAASYYHLKHLIIPDVENGVIGSLRLYNILALLYAFLCMAEMVLTCMPLPVVLLVVLYILFCLVLLLIVPVLGRGVKKWTT